jgi:hypothetical protein
MPGILAISLIIICFCITGFVAYVFFYFVKGKSVIINNKDFDIRGRIYGKNENQNQNKHPAILFLTGWNPGKLAFTPSDFYAGFLADKYNFICLTIALRGMGSAGDITKLRRSDFLEDVISSYDFLSKLKAVDKDNITIIGESFGSYLACILCSKRRVKSVALRVPTDFPDEGFDDTPQILLAGNLSRNWKIKEHHYTQSYALNALHSYKGSVLIVASGCDEYVPKQTTQNYLSSLSESETTHYYLMKSASHALIDPFRQMEYFKVLIRWLMEHRT